MLTRDELTSEEWTAVRNTPHLVLLAVSEAVDGGLDTKFERRAGLDEIVQAMNSTDPLLRQLADASQIMEAQESIRSWYYTLPDAERTPKRMQEKALESMREALAVLAARGKPEDLVLYREFVEALAMRVARAAREGDILGIDGVRISEGETEFIKKLRGLATPAGS